MAGGSATTCCLWAPRVWTHHHRRPTLWGRERGEKRNGNNCNGAARRHSCRPSFPLPVVGGVAEQRTGRRSVEVAELNGGRSSQRGGWACRAARRLAEGRDASKRGRQINGWAPSAGDGQRRASADRHGLPLYHHVVAEPRRRGMANGGGRKGEEEGCRCVGGCCCSVVAAAAAVAMAAAALVV